MKKIAMFLAVCVIFLASSIGAVNDFKVTKTGLRSAAHKAVQKDCQCEIIEWLPKTFDTARAENNDYEVLEVFSSKRATDVWASDLAAYVKLRFSPMTGKYQVLEVDYYNPRVCRNYNY